MANATWPFASLKVNRNQIELNATILGNFVFRPEDVESIEPTGIIPLLGQGIRINHKVSNYKPKVIFWTFENPKSLIKKIKETGFLNNTDPIPENLQQDISRNQSKGGFPIKTKAAVAIVVIWNLLFSIDLFNLFKNGFEGTPLGNGAKLAISFILFTSISLLFSTTVRRLVLKKGQSIDSIKKFIYFIILICAFFLINISAMH